MDVTVNVNNSGRKKTMAEKRAKLVGDMSREALEILATYMFYELKESTDITRMRRIQMYINMADEAELKIEDYAKISDEMGEYKRGQVKGYREIVQLLVNPYSE
jgi:hypothetical protein